jgi:predicted Holliday junction resolvase-like endonuclease
MIKWFVYIVLLLILTPWLSSAKIKISQHDHVLKEHDMRLGLSNEVFIDTIKTAKQKQQEIDEKKKIKEIAKAKRLPKPEKVDEAASSNTQPKVKPKRQRRPPGLERPPEIPRRNGN